MYIFLGTACIRNLDNSRQKYADLSARDNSVNSSDHHSRINVLRACQQRSGLYAKFRSGYRREAAMRAARPLAILSQEITPIPIFSFESTVL